MIDKLLLLICLHALCDYPLQGDFLARGKNHKNPISGVPWYQCLLAHSAIHALAVGLVLGPVFGMAEFVAHALTDYLKSDGAFGFNVDQAIHLLCKLAWVVIFAVSVAASPKQLY